jgi:hypothetical protein
MEYVKELAEWSELAFAVLLLVALSAAYEGGAWTARRFAGGEEKAPEGVNVIVGGMLALLAFVLALTLSYASERFSERRAGALAEVNAISTAWSIAEIIGHPRGKEIGRLLEEYIKMRQDYVEAGRDQARIAELNKTTNALQNTMTGHLAAIVQEQPNPVSAALAASLNESFDAATNERFAYDRGMPTQIFLLLISLSLLAAAVLGYQMGFARRRPRFLAAVLMLGWTIVTVGILDLASPRIGSFRTNSDAYRWTLQSFQGGVRIPPAPARQ